MIWRSVVTLALAAAPLSAQQIPAGNVPASVQHAFNAKFPRISIGSWTENADHNFSAEFNRDGVNIRVTVSPSLGWLETATEMGAINLPEPVRRAILLSYKGFQFVTTWKVERSGAPATVFEVRLSKVGEQVTVRYEPSGTLFSKRGRVDPKPVVVVYDVADVWKGESYCLVQSPGCGTDTVIFRIARVPNDSTAFDISMSKVSGYEQTITNSLACTMDRKRDTLVCVARPGYWEFKAGKDSLSGGLTLDGDIAARRVALKRVP
jgi:hypothetical protein